MHEIHLGLIFSRRGWNLLRKTLKYILRSLDLFKRFEIENLHLHEASCKLPTYSAQQYNFIVPHPQLLLFY